MNFDYTQNPDSAQRADAADLIDSGAQLAEKLNRKKFQRSCVVIVALDERKTVVGVAAVKERQRDVAEIGYLIVHPDFRRRGIAQELTRRRIVVAREIGLRLLFSTIRRDNAESIGNLRKAGFQHWGDFVSAYHATRVISWFFFPLADDVDCAAEMERRTFQLKRPPVTRRP